MALPGRLAGAQEGKGGGRGLWEEEGTGRTSQDASRVSVHKLLWETGRARRLGFCTCTPPAKLRSCARCPDIVSSSLIRFCACIVTKVATGNPVAVGPNHGGPGCLLVRRLARRG